LEPAEDRLIYYICDPDGRFLLEDSEDNKTVDHKPNLHDSHEMTRYKSADELWKLLTILVMCSIDHIKYVNYCAIAYDPISKSEAGCTDLTSFPRVAHVIKNILIRERYFNRRNNDAKVKFARIIRDIINPLIWDKTSYVGLAVLREYDYGIRKLLTDNDVINRPDLGPSIKNNSARSVLHFTDQGEYERCRDRIPHVFAMDLI
jgi:hypothetical protein